MRRRVKEIEAGSESLEVHDAKERAAGVTGVAVALKRSVERMGPARTARTLLRLNQAEGFDCMSCAWPDPDVGHRHTAEFCENGAKAVAEEATKARATPEFFARHSIAELDAQSEHWLGQQGRITHPMVKRPGGTHYEPISWDEAFALVADQLNRLDSPGRGDLLHLRPHLQRGRVRLPAVRPRVRHQQPAGLLQHVPRVDQRGAGRDDRHRQGQREPGRRAQRRAADRWPARTRAPTTRGCCRRWRRPRTAGAKIIAINPLREAGLVNFRNPQKPRGIVGEGTDLADLHLPVKINGDLALFQAIGSLLRRVGRGRPRVRRHLHPRVRGLARHVAPARLGPGRGGHRADPGADHRGGPDDRATPTGDRLLLGDGADPAPQRGGHHQGDRQPRLRPGDIGKPGAGLLPVRGHSNVQGDRTMGIWERPPQHFLDGLQAEFGFDPPREHGYDTVDSIRALRDGKAHVFIGLGGNFVQAAPDTDVTADALRRAAADGAGVDQDQPLAPGLRRDRADPADAGADREGRPGQRRAVRLGGGLDLLGARLPRPAGAGE